MYVLVVIEQQNRRIVHCNVTTNPTTAWTLQQLREAIPSDHGYRFLIHDREGKTYAIVDEWCSGFLQGIALAGEAWQPLLDEQSGILQSFELFATPEGWAELDTAEDEAALHALWSSKIEPTVQAME